MNTVVVRAVRIWFVGCSILGTGCGGGSEGGGPAPDAYVPPVEICNGVDDDLDSVADDGATCAITPGAAQTACVAGACKVMTCAADTADCDGAYATGCEVSTRLDRTHCGGCTPCANGSVCSEGTCVAVATHVFGGAGDQTARDIVDRGGGLLAVGGSFKATMTVGANSISENTHDHGYVWSFSSTFTDQWLSTFKTPTSANLGQTVTLSDLEVASDSSLYYCGGFTGTTIANGTDSASGLAGWSGVAYLGRLMSDGSSDWLIAPAMPSSPSVGFSYAVDLAIGASDVRVAGNWTPQVFGGAPTRGFLNRYDSTSALLSANATSGTDSVSTNTAIPYSTGTLVVGDFQGRITHGASQPLASGSAAFAAEFDAMGADGSLVVVQDAMSQADSFSQAVPIGSGGFAVVQFSAGARSIRAFDAGTQRWSVTVSGANSPLLVSTTGTVYAVATPTASTPVSFGSTTLPASTIPSILVVAINDTTGAIQHIGRFPLGNDLFPSDGVFASDGKLWITGYANGTVNGTPTAATDAFIAAISVAQLP